MASHLKGKSVFITGATSGIGEACAQAFAAEKCRLVLCGRRDERLQELQDRLRKEHEAEVHAFRLDVRDAAAVRTAVASIPEQYMPFDVLINNAGLSRGLEPLWEGDPNDWDEMIDTNVKGLLYITRAVLPAMVERGSGHIIMLGSVAGREVYPGGNVYCASKFAVAGLTRALRWDVNGTGIRVSTVDPGLVNTEFSAVRFHGDAEKGAKAYNGMTPLSGEDVADVVLWVASRPERINVADVLLFPTDQASPFVVHRRDHTESH